MAVAIILAASIHCAVAIHHVLLLSLNLFLLLLKSCIQSFEHVQEQCAAVPIPRPILRHPDDAPAAVPLPEQSFSASWCHCVLVHVY